jgi:hypothetical protein
MSTQQSGVAAGSTRTSSAIWCRWPAAVGLLGAAFVAIVSPDREIGGHLATGCFGVLSGRSVQRALGCLGGYSITSALVTAGAFIGIDPWLMLGGASVVLIVVGLVLRASRTALAAQSLVLVAYGGVGLVALTLGPVAGAVLASLVLMAHAAWDVIHYRRDAVVPRSLAEACMFFDVPFGVAVIVLLLTGLS